MNPPQVYMCSPSWTLLPPPSPFHPSGSSQCTSSKHPVSCIEPGLATHFIHDILHVSMPFSQIFPPSPSPTEPSCFFFKGWVYGKVKWVVRTLPNLREQSINREQFLKLNHLGSNTSSISLTGYMKLSKLLNPSVPQLLTVKLPH